MERFGFVFLVAGLGFFTMAFLVHGVVPMMPFFDIQVLSVEQLAQNVPVDFIELRRQYPEPFEKAFGSKSDQEALAEAIVIGRKTYIAEGCWHCHSQQVRPVGGDEARFGRPHYPEEYNNDMNYPPSWGTRRVGPDLLRESGRHSNDWHVAHFWNPPDVVPPSVMPRYPWFYEEDGLTPNKTGLSIIAYVQWLGSWVENTDETVFSIGTIDRGYPAPAVERPPVIESSGSAPDAETESSDDDGYGDDEYGDEGDADNDDEY